MFLTKLRGRTRAKQTVGLGDKNNMAFTSSVYYYFEHKNSYEKISWINFVNGFLIYVIYEKYYSYYKYKLN